MKGHTLCQNETGDVLKTPHHGPEGEPAPGSSDIGPATGKKRKKSAIPNGEQFMKGTSTDEIRAAYKAEQKCDGCAKAVLILLACLHRRDGKTGSAIAALLGESSSTVYGWLSKMHSGGLEACYDKAKPGRPRKLDSKIHEKISKAIDDGPNKCNMKSTVWTGRLILIMMSSMFDVEVSRSTMYRTLHRMGKSWRMPGRPTDHRAPDKERREEDVDNMTKSIKDALTKGYYVCWGDEAHFTSKTLVGRTWLAKGIRILHKIKPYGQKCTCFATMGPLGIFHQYYDKGNTDSMIEFVQDLYEKYGKVLLILDNATYHKSIKLREHIEKYGGDVQILFQPAYSPDLNPVEMVWKELKKYIANGRYKGVDDLKGAMAQMIDDGTVILPPFPKYALDAFMAADAMRMVHLYEDLLRPDQPKHC